MSPSQRIFPVKVEEALRKDIPNYLGGIGVLEAAVDVEIKSEVEGKVVSILFENGKLVEEDELLIVLDRSEYEVLLENAKASLAAAEAEHHYAKEFARMYGELVDRAFVARIDYEQGVKEVGRILGAIEEAKAQVRLAQMKLDKTEIRSPVKGYVGPSYFEIGSYIQPSQNEILTTVRSVVPLYVSFSLPSEHVEKLRSAQKKQPLRIECFRPQDGEPLLGTVYGIENTVNPHTGMITLHGIIPNTNQEGWPGEFVRVKTLLNTLVDAVVVPCQSVVPTENGKIVFVVQEEEEDRLVVEKRHVEVGPLYEGMSVITSGLSQGERVVTSGKRNLRDGTVVMIEESE